MRNIPVLTLVVLLSTLAPSSVLAQPLPVRLVSVTSPVPPGVDATLTVQTSSEALCLITVRYKSGPSKASGLVPKMADGRGIVAWTWRVGSRTTPGRWPISVTCSAGGLHGTLEASFEVRAGTASRPGFTPGPSASSGAQASRQTICANPPHPSNLIPARVVRIVDGDTIQVLLPNARTESVRLIGIDTPEVYESEKMERDVR